MDYNSDERIGGLSSCISWLLCALPAVVAGVVAVNLFLFTLNPLPLPFLCIILIACDGYILYTRYFQIGFIWELIGIVLPPVYLFRKAKVTGCEIYSAIISVIVMTFSLIAICSMLMLVDTSEPEPEPVIDNDLVEDTSFGYVSFKVGESWIPASGEGGLYYYPDGVSLYMLYMYGTIRREMDHGDYFNIVLDYLREDELYKSITVKERMTPYTTADDREGYISRLIANEKDKNGNTIRHEIDLVIIPDKMFYAVFDASTYEDRELPLDIREITDTATFDFPPELIMEGNKYCDTLQGTLVDFEDDKNFKYYVDEKNLFDNYIYGTYTAYCGEDAIDQIVSMEEYGLTKYDIEMFIFMIQYGDVNIYEHNYDAHVDMDDFYAVVFNVEGASILEEDEDLELDFSTLYLGFYSEEEDALQLVNYDTGSVVNWERRGAA